METTHAIMMGIFKYQLFVGFLIGVVFSIPILPDLFANMKRIICDEVRRIFRR